jgi:lysophospholipase L1-like esterase
VLPPAGKLSALASLLLTGLLALPQCAPAPGGTGGDRGAGSTPPAQGGPGMPGRAGAGADAQAAADGPSPAPPANPPPVDGGPNLDPGMPDADRLPADVAGTPASLDGGAPDAGAAAGPPAVRFVGRIDRTDPAAPRFAWSGTTVLARFNGSSIGVRLGGGANYYDIRIDDVLRPTLATSAGKADYPLASNLGPGPHRISVYRRAEAREGITTFLGLILDPMGGALLPPDPAPDRRIEIVGDSTTCGYGIDGKNASCPFSPATENYDLTYGAVAARALGADLITVAWSAKGMYRNFAGDKTETIPVLYGRTLPLATSTWDFKSWIPHVVVINLGSNDFEQGDPGPGFVTTYADFIHRVHGNYPDAHVLCVVGPKLSGKQLAGARIYVSDMVKALNAAGDTKVSFLELPQAQAGDGFGCGGHASVATHQHMGDTLVADLKAKLGWN